MNALFLKKLYSISLWDLQYLFFYGYFQSRKYPRVYSSQPVDYMEVKIKYYRGRFRKAATENESRKLRTTTTTKKKTYRNVLAQAVE